jgi:hypothetical protein
MDMSVLGDQNASGGSSEKYELSSSTEWKFHEVRLETRENVKLRK